MTQYIDKDALVAKIEKLQSEIAEEKKSHEGLSMWYNGINHGFNLTKELFDTLEVKEVDNIWHTVSESDLPRVGEHICAILGQKNVVSGVYKENKFYGKVCNGYDNSIEKGDKWCYLSDLLVSIGEVKEVDLDFQTFAKEMDDVFALPSSQTENTEENPLNWEYAIAKHFFELGLKVNNEKEK